MLAFMRRGGLVDGLGDRSQIGAFVDFGLDLNGAFARVRFDFAFYFCSALDQGVG